MAPRVLEIELAGVLGEGMATTRETILMFGPLLEPVQSRLEARHNVLTLDDASNGREPNDNLKKVRIVVTGGGTGLSAEWFDRLPALKLVAINGVGTDKVDLERAKRRGVQITTTQGVLADDVADLGMALILNVMRSMRNGDHLVRSGAWSRGENLPLASSLSGKRLGIVGAGAIGLTLGKRASAFSMQLGFWNRSPKETSDWVRFDTVVKLAEWADVLVVTVAASRATTKLIGAEVLKALGPQGYLINIARGSVVDEPALLAALEHRHIAAAGLDVFVNEPQVDERFLMLDNVFLSPHRASATLECRLAMAERVAANIEAFATDQQPPDIVA